MKEECSALAKVLQREKCENSNFAQYEVMGHYRENDSRKKVSALSNNSGWIGKERMTVQYIVGVDNHTRQCVYQHSG